MLPSHIVESEDIDLKKKIEIQRTYVGKIGELAFATLLNKLCKTVDISDMFTIYEGQTNVDKFDFITQDGKYVDIKTGFRANHTRLLINHNQFYGSKKKDFYVAIKLNAKDSDLKNKLVNWDSITEAKVLGYAEYNYLEKYAQSADFGEGRAKYLEYRKLMGIDFLIKNLN